MLSKIKKEIPAHFGQPYGNDKLDSDPNLLHIRLVRLRIRHSRNGANQSWIATIYLRQPDN